MVVVPSKSEELFNIVPVEAMASGVLPLCHDHSAMLEVIDVVRKIDHKVAELMVLPAMKGGAFKSADGEVLLSTLPHMIRNIFNYLYPDGDFEMAEYRKYIGQKLRNIAIDNYSWDKIANAIADTELHKDETTLKYEP